MAFVALLALAALFMCISSAVLGGLAWWLLPVISAGAVEPGFWQCFAGAFLLHLIAGLFRGGIK